MNPETDIRNEEQDLQDIFTIEHALGDFSARIMRWGIGLSGIFILTFVFIGWLVRYPDTLNARGAISTLDPPIDVVTTQGERLQRIRVRNSDEVKRGEVLAVFRTDASEKDVFLLDSLVAGRGPFFTRELPDGLELGTIAPLYQKFRSKVLEKETLQELDITEKQLSHLQQEARRTEELLAVMGRQKAIFEEEIALVSRDVDRMADLLENGAVAPVDFEKKQAELLANKREAEEIELSMLDKQIKVQQLKTQALELTRGRSEEFLALDREIANVLQDLRSALEEWKKLNLLRAPIGGKVSLPLEVSEGVYLPEGAVFCTVVPAQDSAVSIVRASLPAAGAGAIRRGQTAILHLDNYPSGKYGTLSATVKEIALVPASDQYDLILELTDDWITNYGVRIQPQQNLPLMAEIKTEEYNLLQRIFHYFTEQFQSKENVAVPAGD
jgi:multidrug efflux pump subunit AcrA (membrane-fusion protein)